MDLTVFVLLSVCSHQFVTETTQPQIICSSEPVQAVYSEHVLLQCYLTPPLNAASETVKWTRGNDVVILCQNGKYNPGAQREHFEPRTALSLEALTKGNLSLMLSSLKLTDTGRYKCSLITENLEKSCYVNLTVGESDVIGSDEPVKANVGEDVILPCHLEPPFNVSTLTVEWKRNKTYVHVYRSMKHDPNQQNTHFINRTYLFCDEIGKGNISLLLRNVSKDDEGLYICYVPKLHSQVRKGKITLEVDAEKHDTKQFNGSRRQTGEQNDHPNNEQVEQQQDIPLREEQEEPNPTTCPTAWFHSRT
ncbi:butyrophilin subfamily 1 member A1 [Oreochromis niloticus]|uniref:butyrophilin subfamily 1 member A1 n=1 Tax=Oreochromis niloticus TaxID=8128 RepID=UPI000DF43DE9|nr:butyrophilin subfamily 1 member A1-like [Oreochromis niloticus]